MYSTCLHCHSNLGRNESIEQFLVGRRLAFDANKGRLWVICGHCGRWNLAPFEERWEAIEECERRFRGTILRQSTDNVGLARLPDGMELVRIGAPLRPELAAWRYGAEYQKRRARWIPITIGAQAALVAAWALLPGGIYFSSSLSKGASFVTSRLTGRSNVRVLDGIGRVHRLGPDQLDHALLITSGSSDRWAVAIPEARDLRARERARARRRSRNSRNNAAGWLSERDPGALVSREGALSLQGAEARRASGTLMAAINASGATPRELRSALELLDGVGDPDAFCRRLASTAERHGRTEIASLPIDLRLAFEIAAHERTERQAIEGELGQLEQEWKMAEEIAAIADGLLIPPSVEAQLDAARARGSER